MKAWELIKRIFIGALTFVYFAFALFVTILLLNYNNYGVTQFGDTSVVILKEKVSNADFSKGDVIIVEKYNASEFAKGDTAFTYHIEENIPRIEIGKVGDIYIDEKAISFENGDTYSEKFVIGKPEKTFHKVGTFLSIIESKWGFLFIVLVPCFLLFIYQIYALVIEVKYGKDEE